MQPTNELTTSAITFIAAIESLAAEQFLTQIDADWTPRDVVAHLVWWNENMLDVCKGLQRGVTPAYYADAPDYRNINAQAIAAFPSRDRGVLLQQLRATLDAFTHYLRALDAAEWDVERGVTHYRGGAATIRRVAESLAGDYAQHTRQIERMSLRAQFAKQSPHRDSETMEKL